MMNTERVANGRRRVPRRAFDSAVGTLVHGLFRVERSFQVGEGGMMISSLTELQESEQLVVSFYLPTSGMIIVRGVVRSIVKANSGTPLRYGVEFLNLGFHHRRDVRNYVSAATHLEGHSRS